MDTGNSSKFYFTVEQMIEILKTFPADLPVLVSGYESGYDNFYQPFVMKVKHKPLNPEFEGEFEAIEKNDKRTFDVVILQRVMRD